MSGRLFGYARVSVAREGDANNLENQRRVLADCEQNFKSVESEDPRNRSDCGDLARRRELGLTRQTP